MQGAEQPWRLAARDLACRRGDRLLFRGLSFTLNGGEVLHLSGPNGVGKSSLIRILAGLVPAFAGNVDRRGACAMLDERLALDPQLPLERALAFWQRMDGAPALPLDDLGLNHLVDVPVRYLSTGQRKRAGLARLLMQQAPIWLLDEPLNGLDTNAVQAVERLVEQHLASGGLCVIASHQALNLPSLQHLDLSEAAA